MSKKRSSDIGGRLRKARKRLGHTQTQAAEIIGAASWNTVSLWENGRRTPCGMYRRAVEHYLRRAEKIAQGG